MVILSHLITRLGIKEPNGPSKYTQNAPRINFSWDLLLPVGLALPWPVGLPSLSSLGQRPTMASRCSLPPTIGPQSPIPWYFEPSKSFVLVYFGFINCTIENRSILVLLGSSSSLSNTWQARSWKLFTNKATFPFYSSSIFLAIALVTSTCNKSTVSYASWVISFSSWAMVSF